MRAVKYRPAIRFFASIRLPESGHFLCEDDFKKDPKDYITRWIAGGLSVIYSGPLINPKGEFNGELIIVPRVNVRLLQDDGAMPAKITGPQKIFLPFPNDQNH